MAYDDNDIYSPDQDDSGIPALDSPEQAAQKRRQQLLQQLEALHPPAPGKPSIWQRLGAAALGGVAGALNANPRNAQINAQPAMDAILHPGYQQKQQRYQQDVDELTREYGLERQQDQDATTALYRASLVQQMRDRAAAQATGRQVQQQGERDKFQAGGGMVDQPSTMSFPASGQLPPMQPPPSSAPAQGQPLPPLPSPDGNAPPPGAAPPQSGSAIPPVPSPDQPPPLTPQPQKPPSGPAQAIAIPPPPGYNAVSAAPYDQAGTQRFSPTPAEVARQKTEAAQAGWQAVPDKVAEYNGLDKGTKLPPQEFNALVSQYYADQRQKNKPLPKQKLSTADLAIMAAGGDPNNPASVTPQIAEKALQKSKPAGPTLSISPAAVDQNALRFLQTGELPSMGYGREGAQVRAQIINRAAELQPNANLAVSRADYQSLQGSARSLRRQNDTTMAFERTASANLDNALNAAQKVDATGSPLFNRIYQAAQSNIWNDADLQAFKTYVTTAANEYAKVVTNNGASGSVTDAAKREAQTLLSQTMSPEAFQAAVTAMKTEMENRRSGYQQQLQEIESAMQKGGTGSMVPPSETSSGPTKLTPAEALTYLQKAGWKAGSGKPTDAQKKAAADLATKDGRSF